MAPFTRRRALGTLGAAFAAVAAVPQLAHAADRSPGGQSPSAARPAGAAGHPRLRPLAQAHAHNDYEHPRPLLDALDHRFTSVEADIFLVGGKLLVAHDPEDLDPKRTLESLYLDPLAARVRANHGSVYRRWHGEFQLLVDIKTEGASTYRELDLVLRRYRHLFTTYAHGKVRRAAVTAVISGDRAARAPMEAQRVRRAFYDGRLADLGTAAPASFIPLISDNWSLNFTWQGVGAIPPAERQKLRDIVSAAHRRGQRVRFWATPDLAGPQRDAVWSELLAAGVDHLNTDDLAGLQRFLDARGR
ncbi:phosphatidylinositol-specific phospholipase C/glycerophosphodiester phosphodiesterase family protein [Streptomyces flavofungini]|uniref:phosphatidylinositol-specific phospholipase C/glycerophosphodiester phosphodiesterase family protein n=1 Tax=Streptomyces flavofungini TaxID=68200 RepID=UPI0025B02E55|nr:phosphatidylinositol-specific phospholipase C/glycerophosphodiester phosphodiesterase family protein [Streptomyces flavofungini]WJV44635.1 phosphatidylinositol-specific phospholipase C/glycerophosphodiester phosphodiesterase family protein [Streptomyces flavofungini]